MVQQNAGSNGFVLERTTAMVSTTAPSGLQWPLPEPQLSSHQVHILLLPTITPRSFSSESNTHQSYSRSIQIDKVTDLISTLPRLRRTQNTKHCRDEFPSLAANSPRCGPNRSLSPFHLQRRIICNIKPVILPVRITRAPQACQATAGSPSPCGLDELDPKCWTGSPNVSLRSLLQVRAPIHVVYRRSADT